MTGSWCVAWPERFEASRQRDASPPSCCGKPGAECNHQTNIEADGPVVFRYAASKALCPSRRISFQPLDLVRGLLQYLGQHALAIDERRRPDVKPVEPQQIEYVVEHPIGAAFGEVVLQPVEIWAALLVGHHHFTVDDETVRREMLQSLGDRSEAGCPVVAAAAVDRRAIGIERGLRPISVELEFVDPSEACRRLVSQRRKARLDETGERRRLGSSQSAGDEARWRITLGHNGHYDAGQA